jgi:hypothetical protein
MKIDRGTVRALAIATQLGFTIAAAVGLWVDDRLGTRPAILLVGIVFGLP